MKAILIMPGKQAVEFIDINGCGDIRNIIDYNTIEYDAVGNDDNRPFL